MKRNRLFLLNMLSLIGLFCVFCTIAFGVIVLGAQIFRSNSSQIENHFSGPTALNYITQKAKQNDTTNALFLQDIEGTHALVIPSASAQGYAYFIYHHEGFIKEIYAKDDISLSLSGGQQLVAAKELTFEDDNGLLMATVVTEDGQSYDVTLPSMVKGGAQ